MTLWRWVIRTIGAISIALSTLGAYWLMTTAYNVLGRPCRLPDQPYFREVFGVMNSINAVLLVLMILTCIGLLRVRPSAIRAYTWLNVAICVYFFGVATLWWIPGPLGMSIAGATGVGNMGIAPLILMPYPKVPFVSLLLAVVLANVAKRQLDRCSQQATAFVSS